MKVLVVGAGGREHALCWKLAQSPRVSKIYAAPGNAGTAGLATNVPLGAEDVEGIVRFARSEGIDLTVVGPEAPLVLGLVDRLRDHGLRVFGPSAAAARLEGSKAFAKAAMERFGVPTAQSGVFTERKAAGHYLHRVGAPIVVKADGLAAGKGVVVAQTTAEAEAALDQMMVQGLFGEAGRRVLLEEFLQGEEASFLAFCDGRTVVAMPSTQDHKRVFDGDRGPNTGGMGAYSPAPVVTPEIHEEVLERVFRPTVEGMAREGIPYVGVLYAGLMIHRGAVKVLEYNCRFGDPECQPLLARLTTDLVPVLEACIDGRLSEARLEWDSRAAACVVLASEGYPGTYPSGVPIEGLEAAAARDDVLVFHSGTRLEGGRTVTAGGRVLGVTALGFGLPDAVLRAYDAVHEISWPGMHYRTDIAQRGLQAK
jgi:phosphoribosylamine---glycine ligase